MRSDLSRNSASFIRPSCHLWSTRIRVPYRKQHLRGYHYSHNSNQTEYLQQSIPIFSLYMTFWPIVVLQTALYCWADLRIPKEVLYFQVHSRTTVNFREIQRSSIHRSSIVSPSGGLQVSRLREPEKTSRWDSALFVHISEDENLL